MKLFSLFADLVLDTGQFNKGVGEATRQGKTMASSLSGGFTMMTAKAVALGNAMYDVGKQAAKSAVNFTKQIVNEYAEAEQLIGGVQAIFGQSADTVLKNADNAFRTAGMSANEYMQTVTSFSSSLIQSLKGDTAEATRYADMAITDMSDNANRFGTDIGMIQNAYQGFAKQNYTMLDNLKLGYGGTQKEMQRLLKDAQKIQRANGVNVRYNINNLADVYEAIHVIQTAMGVTGTTAAEASETIAGSFNAFKSTWKNLLSGMAKDDADIAQLLGNMFDSGKTLLKNIYDVLPTIGQHAKAAFKFVTDKAKEAAPVLYQTFKDTWDKKLPAIVQDGANGIIGIINSSFGTSIPKITSIDFPTWDEITTKFNKWWGGENGTGGVKKGIEDAASWTLQLFKEPTATKEEAGAAIADWWNTKGRPGVQEFCTWALNAPESPYSTEGEAEKIIEPWWSTVGGWIEDACSWNLKMFGMPDETADDVGNYVKTWWNGISKGLDNTVLVGASVLAGDEEATKKSVNKWWEDIKGFFLDEWEASAKINPILILDKESKRQAQAVEKSALETRGEDVLTLGRERRTIPLLDMLSTLAASGEWAGGISETTFDEWLPIVQKGGTSQEYMDVEAAIIKKYEELLDGSWDKDTGGEDKEGADDLSSSLESLNSNIAALQASIDGLNSKVDGLAAASASALAGAKVEMDGATVGRLVLPYVSSGLSRANRVAYKSAVAPG